MIVPKHHERIFCTLVWKLVTQTYWQYCKTIYIATSSCWYLPGVKYKFLVRWFFGEFISNAQTSLWHSMIFLWLSPLLFLISLPYKNSLEFWCSLLIFETLPLETVPIDCQHSTNIITCFSLSIWKSFFPWCFKYQVLWDKAQWSSFGEASGIHLCKEWV